MTYVFSPRAVRIWSCCACF